MASQTPFYGCCGGTIIYMGNSTVLTGLKPLLNSLTTGIAVMMLKHTQVKILDKGLKKIGFLRAEESILNPNTQNDLYLYWIDLNQYREQTTKKVTKRTFGK